MALDADKHKCGTGQGGGCIQKRMIINVDETSKDGVFGGLQKRIALTAD